MYPGKPHSHLCKILAERLACLPTICICFPIPKSWGLINIGWQLEFLLHMCKEVWCQFGQLLQYNTHTHTHRYLSLCSVGDFQGTWSTMEGKYYQNRHLFPFCVNGFFPLISIIVLTSSVVNCLERQVINLEIRIVKEYRIILNFFYYAT